MRGVGLGLLLRVRRARLASQVIRRLRRAGVSDARYDAGGFRVRFTADGDETPTILELAPLLAAQDAGRRDPGRRDGGRWKRGSRRERGHRREQLDRFVAGLVGTPGLPTTWAGARPLLRPVLRGGTPGSPLRRAVLPLLFEYVVVDRPDTMTYLSREQPTAWGVTTDEVFEAARANLSGAALHGVADEPVVVRFVDDGDAYWTSHLLLPHWLERLAGQVGGVPVAFAPQRGTLLVTADGSGHLSVLFAEAEEIYAKSSRPITPMAYVSDANGCPVPYHAPPGHPLHHMVQRAERVLAIQEYTRQATAADTTAPPADPTAPPTDTTATPKAAGMAELQLVGSVAEGWRTRALWHHDQPVLLPEADEVQLGAAVCPWADVRRHLTRVPGLDPPRWSADHWPPP
jgi:hypothetical protein